MRTTPSMDDKATPSPPCRDDAAYTTDKACGVNPVGFAFDKQSWEAHATRCRLLKLDPEVTPYHAVRV